MKSTACFLSCCMVCAFMACHSTSGNANNNDADSTGKATGQSGSAIPEDRAFPQTQAVDSLREKTDNPLNNWYFSVKLYETSKTFRYLLKMKFEELDAEDTLEFPEIGRMPKPVLKKGQDKYSCIIGFLDQADSFREYKLVHVDNGNLKLTSLKHYAMAPAR